MISVSDHLSTVKLSPTSVRFFKFNRYLNADLDLTLYGLFFHFSVNYILYVSVEEKRLRQPGIVRE